MNLFANINAGICNSIVTVSVVREHRYIIGVGSVFGFTSSLRVSVKNTVLYKTATLESAITTINQVSLQRDSDLPVLKLRKYILNGFSIFAPKSHVTADIPPDCHSVSI